MRATRAVRLLLAIGSVLLASTPALADGPGGDNLIGHRGLLRTTAAFNHPSGLVGVGTDLQYFSASDLLASGQKHSRLVNSYSVTWAPLRFLEAAFALHVVSDNSSSAGQPDELQVAVGDPEISLKGGAELGHGFAAGGLFDLRFAAGAGFVEPAGAATTITLLGLASWQRAGFTAHLNFGIVIDGSDNLFDNPDKLTAAQLFSAQVSTFNRLVTRVGAEYDTSYVSPFLELSLEPFIGSGAPGFGDSPGTLSFGVRAWPTQSHGLQLLAALDVGLIGVGDGSPATLAAGDYAYVIPRWNLVLRASYRFDPFAKPTLVVEDRVSDVTPEIKRGVVRGVVVDGRSNKPVWAARIKIATPDSDEVSNLAVDPEQGRFRTYRLPTGRRTLTATAEGYRPASVTVEVEADQEVETTIRLMPKAEVAPGTVRGTVKAVGKDALKSATMLIPEVDQTIAIGEDGAFSATLKPGAYTIVFSAPGYRAQRKRIRVLEGGTVILNVDLHAR